MKLYFAVCGAFLALTGAARATVVTATFTGTLSGGEIQQGGSVSPLDGLPFSLVFTLDTSKGVRTTFVDLNSGMVIDEIYGGSSYSSSAPVFADLEINGKHTVFGGTNGYFATQSSPVQNYLLYEAQGIDTQIHVTIINNTGVAFNYLSPFSQNFFFPADPGILGTYEDGDFRFGYSFSTLLADHLDVTVSNSIPEVSTWVMMILGFAGVIAHRHGINRWCAAA